MQAQCTIGDGLRQSSAECFLRPAQSRQNLHIATHCYVTKVYICLQRDTSWRFLWRKIKDLRTHSDGITYLMQNEAWISVPHNEVNISRRLNDVPIIIAYTKVCIFIQYNEACLCISHDEVGIFTPHHELCIIIPQKGDRLSAKNLSLTFPVALLLMAAA